MSRISELTETQWLAALFFVVFCAWVEQRSSLCRGEGEEVDGGYLETGTNLVSVVSILSLSFSLSVSITTPVILV